MLRHCVLLAAVGFLVGCGSEGAGPADIIPPTLTRYDVAGMLPGNALGTIFSGTYLVEDASVDACVCRAGDCLPFHALSGASVSIAQKDGVLVSGDTALCTGGIDQDGRFWCGEAEESGTQAIYGREHGMFVLGDGRPALKQFTAQTTMVVTLHGVAYDCDLQAKGTARYVGP